MENDGLRQQIEAARQREAALREELEQEQALRQATQRALAELLNVPEPASGQRGEAGEPSRTPEEVAIPVKIVQDSSSTHRFFRGAGTTLSALAALVAIVGLPIAIIKYQKSLDELNATTLYTVAKEARTLATELAAGRASTGLATNYYFSVYYLNGKDVIADEMWPLMLSDFCSFIHDRTAFDDEWSQIEELYPENFRDLVAKLQELSSCSRSSIQELIHDN